MAGIPQKDSPTPIKALSVSDIKARLLRPSLTSQYIVDITPPETDFILPRVDYKNSVKRYDRLSLACVEASLPGSSLATLDIDNDYAGVSEKHGYRRIYDDRIDFTFFVDADEYYAIRFFEAWIAYIVNEQSTGFDESNYTYRVHFPGKPIGKSIDKRNNGGYYANNLSITKFERDYNLTAVGGGTGNFLTYKFINAFPISIGSMPVSYEQSSLLRCTVSFSYSRYRIDNGYSILEEEPKPTVPGSPTNSTSSRTSSNKIANNLTTPTFTATEQASGAQFFTNRNVFGGEVGRIGG